ncbi:MAG: uroporphyrinogen decarboxylase family protein [bacterium]|jgi:uroporphyrinogen decarboxylase|nr:uroporphyrinogen decarboxylase family protein [bacterium]MDD3805033.1 uroporphyrinogen decarboxylase family protein [bacterium]MDD4152435.1 uroporphyrinogen decarboxylase family protein [bacterium]
MKLNIKPNPDFDNRLKPVLLRQGTPDRVPFFELFADAATVYRVLDRPAGGDIIKDRIDFQYRLGYDYATLWISGNELKIEGRRSDGHRTFNIAGQSTIRSWKDFENYPWPRLEGIDFSALDKAAAYMPEGMKGIVLIGHQLESPMKIMGYEGLAYALADDPDLVEAVFNKIGAMELYCYKNCVESEAVGAMLISDDLGFKNGTLISPDNLRNYVFPWYKRFTDVCHSHNIPVILHSCGKLDAVMEDIIGIGIDAKHSYEDQIMPVTEMKQRYGDRIAVLGGMDMDFLCRRTPDEIRARTREILEICMPGGGYALGTGNSVADYVPVENYLAMLDEGWKAGVY